MTLKFSPKSVRSMRVVVVLFCFVLFCFVRGSRLRVGPVSHPYESRGCFFLSYAKCKTFVCKNKCIRTWRLKYEFAHSYNQELKH